MLLARLVGMVGLLLYGLWALGQVTGNIPALMAAEEGALQVLSNEIAGGGMTRAGPAAAGVAVAVAWVLVCVASILYLTVISHRWIKQIVFEWKWVWRHFTSGSPWDKLWALAGFVLVFCETVVWVAITVVTVVITVINVLTLMKVPLPL